MTRMTWLGGKHYLVSKYFDHHLYAHTIRRGALKILRNYKSFWTRLVVLHSCHFFLDNLRSTQKRVFTAYTSLPSFITTKCYYNGTLVFYKSCTTISSQSIRTIETFCAVRVRYHHAWPTKLLTPGAPMVFIKLLEIRGERNLRINPMDVIII